MVFGPTQIIACPHCKGLAANTVIASGNNFGATLWSDGLLECPHYPDEVEFVKCVLCDGFYWKENADIVDIVDVMADSSGCMPPWLATMEIAEPTEAEYLSALDFGFVFSAQQKRLRLLAFWRGNEPWRKGVKLSLLERSINQRPRVRNLGFLSEILSTGDESDRILEAEIYRELGEFRRAEGVLTKISFTDSGMFAAQIRAFCQVNDSSLRKLVLPVF